MIVYKVVQVDEHGRLWSYNTCPSDLSAVRIEYIVGVLTRPRIPGSKLFAFESLDAARDWRNSINRIYKASAEGVEEMTGVPYISPDTILVCEFWDKPESRPPYSLDIPGGVVCDYMTLIEEVR